MHGWPTRSDYEILKSKAGALASKVKDITYAWSKNDTDNYGLLGNILREDEYDELMGIRTYTMCVEPASYDPTVTNATLTHKRKRKVEEWLVRTSWFIRKGFLQGILDNLRNALNKQYYSQLRYRLTAYHIVTPFQILEHLNDCWCPLDIKAKKALKDAYYMKWDGDKHLTVFGKRLDKDQRALVRSNVMIADKDKLQFYLEQMYDRNHFDKNKMLAWEKQPTATKTDFDAAKNYFEALVKATDTYEMNAGGGTTGRNKYESANQLADYGNEIREYIAKIVGVSVGAASSQAANADATTKQFAEMAAQIKALTAAVTQLAATKENSNPNATRGNGGGNRESRQPQVKKLRNMGGYCSSHGFHPVGTSHNSTTCRWQKGKHNMEATWNNQLGGNMYWPTATRVAIEQQDHPTWKGKLAPTN